MGRVRILGLTAIFTLVWLATVSGIGSASDSVATTGNATTITSARATLNGVIDPSFTDNIWFFQYSTTSDFSANVTNTTPVAAGAGISAVSETVRGLTPRTTYYFRVVVGAQPDTTRAPVYHTGKGVGFTTLSRVKDGVGALVGSSFKLRGGTIGLPLTCSGSAGSLCTAYVGLLATSPAGKAVVCGTGTLVAAAPHRHTVYVKPSSACKSLVSHTTKRRLKVKFIAVYTTNQSRTSKTVTITG